METKYIWTTLRIISEAQVEKVESDRQKVLWIERDLLCRLLTRFKARVQHRIV